MYMQLEARGSPLRWAARLLIVAVLCAACSVGVAAEECTKKPELWIPSNGEELENGVSVQKVAPSSVCAGEEILVTVTVDNMSCGAAGAFDLAVYYDVYDEAHLIKTLPADDNPLYIPGLDGCEHITHTFTWDTTGVPPGAHTVLVWADPDNTVIELTDDFVNNKYQMPTEVMIYPYAPWIEATKTDTDLDGGKVYPGDTVKYTIVIRNEGCADQGDNPGHEFTDVLPDSVAATGTVSASDGTAALDGNTLNWDGIVPAGGSVTITVTVKVDEEAEDGQVICNQGTVHWDSNADGSNNAQEPTDDPETPTDDDPTCFTVSIPANPATVGTIDAPTLSEWAQILFSVLMAGSFIVMLVRRRRATA